MIFVLLFVLGALACLVSYVQLLYLESQRLRRGDAEAFDHFRERLEGRLGMDTTAGALTFSLWKHTLYVLAGALLVAASAASERAAWLDLLEGAGLAWLLMIGAGYLLPQILYRRSSGAWAEPLVPLLRLLALIVRPLTMLLLFMESLHELSRPSDEPGKQATAEQEIDALIEAGEDEGILEKEDSRLIQSVVAFGDKRVREVMTPRKAMVCIEASRSLDDLRQLVKNEQYSRVPVYEDTVDRIIGFVHVRDLFELDEDQRAARTLRSLMRKIEAVPESKPVALLLREMQSNGTHIVYVVDEYGNVAGLATMEDLVEEVFGEIRDEHEPPHDVEEGADGSITVSGSFDLDHLAERFGFRPAEGTEATTAGGLATEWHGAVPRPGTVVLRNGMRLEVLASDGLRVERVRISAIPEEPKEDGR